jgi:hypothetical protein
MKDDKELMARCSKENPFKTPKGYFVHFHDQLMDSLPEVEPVRQESAKVSLFTHIKPWLYMAAMFVSTVFVIQGLMFVQESKFSTNSSVVAEELYSDEADHFMSSSLYNEYALYSYLTSGE